MRVVILGAGFGGLEVATRLCDALGPSADVSVVDRSDGFVFGFSKLDVLVGRATPAQVLHRYADLRKAGLRFIASTVRAIDPVAKQVVTEDEVLQADVLVVALGADVDPSATPGLVEGGHEFYSVEGAVAAAAALERFAGGDVLVAVTSTPFKCPPAPSEAALLVHDLLVARGVASRSRVSLAMPMGVPIPPSPDASAAVLHALGERGIGWLPDRLVHGLDPARRVALLSNGDELPYDLFLGVPVHQVPSVVDEAGVTTDGWVHVDPVTLQTAYPDVYAIGDVTSVGTPKAGVFAEGQAAVVAERIIASHRGVEPMATYDGHGVCYMQVGASMVAKVDVTFAAGRPPTGTLEGPSTDLVADKEAFGRDRVERWFGRPWQRP